MTAPEPSWRTEPCRSCQAPVVWADTENGKAMPVDAEPNPERGTHMLVPRAGLKPLAAGVAQKARRFAVRPLHTSHFATCPQAAGWRKRGTS